MLYETTELFVGLIMLNTCQFIHILKISYADIIFPATGKSGASVSA